jgi:predicted type IV restriction endonuclease
MYPDINIESKVIENYILKSKRERYLNFIKNPKTRKKFTDELAHFSSQLENFEEIKTSEREVINEKLKRIKSTQDCYVISENSEIDGKRMKIDNALTEAIGMGMGTLIVFGNADLVFYEGEGPSDRWIKELKK